MQAKVTLLEHPADLGIEVVAATPTAVVEALGLQLTGLVCSGVDLGPLRSFSVVASGLDAVETLIAWLNELLYAQQAANLLISAITFERCTTTRIEATISGVDFDPHLHQRHYEIKAVTYHLAALEPVKDGWRAQVFLDL